MRVLTPITAHPSRLPVDLARTAEFVSGVKAGRRSDAVVGGLLYTRPPSSSCQINQSLAEWFGERDIPPSLTLSLSAFSPPLSVCPFQPRRALTRANSKPRKPHLAYISPLDTSNTSTLKILFAICGIFDGEVTLVSVLQIQICPLLFSLSSYFVEMFQW